MGIDTLCHVLLPDSGFLCVDFSLFPRSGAFLILPLPAAGLAAEIGLVAFVFQFLVLPNCLLFLPGQLHFPERRRDVLAHKIEVDLHRLGGFDTALTVTFMDKDFLDKLIEHGIRHVLEALVFVNQGNKLLCRFLSLVVIADGLFQLGNLGGKCLLLLGVLCVQRGIAGVWQASQGVILINFTHKPFQLPGPFLCRRQPPLFLLDVAVLLAGLGLLHLPDKRRPVRLGKVGNRLDVVLQIRCTSSMQIRCA